RPPDPRGAAGEPGERGLPRDDGRAGAARAAAVPSRLRAAARGGSSRATPRTDHVGDLRRAARGDRARRLSRAHPSHRPHAGAQALARLAHLAARPAAPHPGGLMRAPAQVAVIGAGWAGIAAAIHLTRANRAVRLIDAAPQAGGRARRITLEWTHPRHGRQPIELDNGQHLLLGAYTEVLDLLRLTGGAEAARMERYPMRFAGSGGLLLER